MGNDGGVIAVQRKFLRHGQQKRARERTDRNELLLKRVSTCALTDEPLREPIVACEMGNLYNKEALISKLLDKTLPESFAHIRGLRDVVPCQFTKNPVLEQAKDGDVSSKIDKDGVARFVCPVTLTEFNGHKPFVILWSCGCVVSERALRELSDTRCPMCSKEFAEDDQIKLIPEEADLEKRRSEMKTRRQKRKAAKKSKKRASEGMEGAELNTGHVVKSAKVKHGKKSRKEAPTHVVVQSKSKSGAAVEAMKAVEEGKSKSQVYASLFSKNNKVDANELMMTVGGLRYTLK